MGSGNELLLPDSRLADPKGSLMVDWPLPGGGTQRIEVVPVYCANCGKPYGHVPRDNTAFAFWLCTPCYETYGDVAGTYAIPDDEFNKAVQYEMEERFGHALNPLEIEIAVDRGELGSALENLIKESPYPVANDP